MVTVLILSFGIRFSKSHSITTLLIQNIVLQFWIVLIINNKIIVLVFVQHLEDYFKTCLLTAHNNNMRSIAFPSIGTGSMGISADYVANMMYSETKSFSTQNPNTSLTNINFVVFDDKTTKVSSTMQHSCSFQRIHNQLCNYMEYMMIIY